MLYLYMHLAACLSYALGLRATELLNEQIATAVLSNGRHYNMQFHTRVATPFPCMAISIAVKFCTEAGPATQD